MNYRDPMPSSSLLIRDIQLTNTMSPQFEGRKVLFDELKWIVSLLNTWLSELKF